MSPLARKRLGSAARLAVCAGAVALLIARTRWEEFADVVRSANPWMVVLSILAFAPSPVLISLRLKWLLTVHGIHLSLWQAIKATFAGNFIIAALPVGTPGGDAVKAYYVAGHTAAKHEAVTTVFFDRVIGVVGLILMSGLMVLLNWGSPAFAKYGPMIGVMAALFVVGTAIYYVTWLRRLFCLDAIMARLPLAHHVQRIDKALLEFRGHGRLLLAALILTLILQGIGIISLWIGGIAVGLVGDSAMRAVPVYFGYVPICYLMGLLPIGVMELTFTELFSTAAELGPRAAAIALSILCRLAQFVCALPGGVVVLRGGAYKKAMEEAGEGNA